MNLDISNRAQPESAPSKGRDVKLDLAGISGTVHFVGIGGIGMSALAKLLLARGIAVSGSDKEATDVTDELAALGARIALGHRAENIEGAGALVISTAIAEENPEIQAAARKSLPVWHRSQMLYYLTGFSRLIAVSGTHGKTTTTGMVAQILLDCGLDPSVVVGGIFGRIGSNGRIGQGEYFVAEADESDGTHAAARSDIAVITNIEADHLENYPGGIEQIRDNMIEFANNAQTATVLCQDDLGCRLVRSRINGKVITYGNAATSPDADYTYESLDGFGMRVYRQKEPLGEIRLSVPGEHNKQNALSAVVVGLLAGLDFAPLAEALGRFNGVARRFQIVGRHNGITIVDDYAHHPTEVAATLQAARQFQRECAAMPSAERVERIVAVFQPHQPGRLRDLWDEFCGAFTLTDLLILADVYIARGQAIAGIDSERFGKSVNHGDVVYLPGNAGQLAPSIKPHLRPGDLVLTIGAGDITKVGPALLRLLQQDDSDGRVS